MFSSVTNGLKKAKDARHPIYRIVMYGFLVLWLWGLVVVDVTSFPYYLEIRSRLERLEGMAGSLMIPTFYKDGRMKLREYVVVYRMTMGTDSKGATMYTPVMILKEDVAKFLKYDNKNRYEARKKG